MAFEPPPAAMLPTERSTGVSSALALSGSPLLTWGNPHLSDADGFRVTDKPVSISTASYRGETWGTR